MSGMAWLVAIVDAAFYLAWTCIAALPVYWLVRRVARRRRQP